MKRLGVKATNHTGQRHIFFILDRATRKFHGDIGLWMQYVSFARKQKSKKKVAEILTRVLRLHPTKPELWIYAANYALEERGDVTEARSYMQRGLRFCGKREILWIEYARLELIYIAKIVRRGRVLGLDQAGESKRDKIPESEVVDDELISLPVIIAEKINPDARSEDVDQKALQKFDASPISLGAIPIAVFDAAYKHLPDEEFALAFFDMVAEFNQIPCQHTILDHVMAQLKSRPSQTPALLMRYIRAPVIGISVDSVEFPSALGTALSRIKPASKSLDGDPASSELDSHLIQWVLLYINESNLDADLKKVLEMSLQKLWTHYQSEIGATPEGKAPVVIGLLEKLETMGFQQIAKLGRSWASNLWPNEPSLSSVI